MRKFSSRDTTLSFTSTKSDEFENVESYKSSSLYVVSTQRWIVTNGLFCSILGSDSFCYPGRHLSVFKINSVAARSHQCRRISTSIWTFPGSQVLYNEAEMAQHWRENARICNYFRQAIVFAPWRSMASRVLCTWKCGRIRVFGASPKFIWDVLYLCSKPFRTATSSGDIVSLANYAVPFGRLCAQNIVNYVEPCGR